jgi:Fe-S cluster biogenesis protein NfuA
MTMKAGIETAVKQAVPEIKSVIAVNLEPAV